MKLIKMYEYAKGVLKHRVQPLFRGNKKRRGVFVIVTNEKNVIHRKTGNIYSQIGVVINATNSNDGESMMLYCKDNVFYVRKVEEYNEKFVTNVTNKLTI